MKILILWASLADYTVACFKQLALKEGVTIMLVYQPVHGNAPFNGFNLSLFTESIEDKNVKETKLTSMCLNFKPDIVFMASWNYSHYMSVSKKCKKNGAVILSSFDNQWKNTIKQNFGRIISPLFLKPVIDNFLVPGDRQAQFAMKLGYNQPFQGFYCANSHNFTNSSYNSNTKQFLFIGRLIEQKGVRSLIAAYNNYRSSVTNPWELCIAGEGPLKTLFQRIEGIKMKSFVQPTELADLFSESSCFVLPSLHENWGLVIHEAALAGQPIISTSACGATTWFLRDGQNGYLIDSEVSNLTSAFIQMHNKKSEELQKMSVISKTLGYLWNLDSWADYVYESFINLIHKD